MSAAKGRALLTFAAAIAILTLGAYIALNVEKAEAADTTPPTASIDSGPGDTSDGAAAFTFSADEPSTFECKLVTSANATVSNWASCTSPKTYSSLADGDYIFRVRATDSAGNLGVVKGLSFTVTNGGGSVAQCADGIDNDGDGKIDLADPGCSSASDNDETNSPPTGGSAVVVGAGDISSGTTRDNQTGDLVRQQLSAGAYGAFTTGDNAYPDGTYQNYQQYDASWGSFKSKTRPTFGNHDYYASSSAAGANQYWNQAPAVPVPGGFTNSNSYYSYDVPGTNWTEIHLNSASTEGPNNNAPSCATGSPQITFLQNQLNRGRHTVLFWHHARFSRGSSHDTLEGDDGCSKTFFDIAHDNGADLAMEGHTHAYERYDTRDKAGNKTASGLTSVVCGTGGNSFDALTGVGPSIDKGIANSWGICKLSMSANSVRVQYLPAPGAPGSDDATVAVRP